MLLWTLILAAVQSYVLTWLPALHVNSGSGRLGSRLRRNR